MKKDTETILLANHGTVTYGTDLEDAYFKTEIIDAYCRILLLAKQLGRVHYYPDEKAAELIKLKPNLNIPDPRLRLGLENCDLCGNNLFREGYGEFAPESKVYVHPKLIEGNQQHSSIESRLSPPAPPQKESPASAIQRSPDEQRGGGNPVNLMSGLGPDDHRPGHASPPTRPVDPQ